MKILNIFVIDVKVHAIIITVTVSIIAITFSDTVQY